MPFARFYDNFDLDPRKSRGGEWKFSPCRKISVNFGSRSLAKHRPTPAPAQEHLPVDVPEIVKTVVAG